MIRTTSQQNKNRLSKIYMIAGAVGLVFLLLCISIIIYMSHLNEQENLDYLQESGKQNKLSVINHVSGDFEIMKGISTCISYIQDWSPERLVVILNEINSKNSFIRMGYASTDGIVDMLDINGQVYKEQDIAKEKFFLSALNGQNAISDTLYDEYLQGYVNYIAVPVYKENQVIGVLCAVNETDVYRDIVVSALFNGEGFSSIINSRGEYMVNTNHPNAVRDVATIRDIGTIDAVTYQTVLTDMQSNHSGYFDYTSAKGTENWAYYEPLELNDWYILSVVPQSAFKQIFNKIMLYITLIITGCYVLFLILLFMISRITKQNQKKLEEVAYKDPLTGCRTHLKFIADAQLLLSGNRDENYAVWYFDIRRFKFINDIFGYDTGDKILRALAAWLRENCGKFKLFSRVSADNFEGIIPYTDVDALKNWVGSFLSELPDIVTTTAGKYKIETSIGIYCLEKNMNLPPVSSMLNWANMAQKSAKANGISYAFYSDEIRENVHRETEMSSRMQEALAHNEFALYLQPKVNIINGNRIAGAEALVRWNSKTQGVIPPSEFIPLFERNGFIIELDRYMFEQVCKYLHHRIESGRPKIVISVNVSRLALFQEDFIEFYTAVKTKYAIPDGLLDLEFTESIIFGDDVFFSETVEKLQNNGFTCSLDDFGSGYSSLNVLKDLPINVLKLDILFFHSSTAELKKERIVVSNIVSMARELNIVTVAEGVEDAEQVDFLRKIGCDMIQGYVFSKPLPCSDFDQLYENTSGRLEPRQA